ncbi:ROK family protein [Enterococcus sp. CWB-B31]|uniref:ROK family protein n=2 Tax=Enterococcus TaxID=1350 RepID=UPI001E502B5B|nr:ROK family protein [Enterococcus sp. CWB-B31]MCB5955778.1 ROK family protein [Enterococcus sp. CWB-B31]
MAILAFDLGGSAVKYGVWEKNELHETGSFVTPKTWKEMKASLSKVIKAATYSIEGIGMSAPGAVDEEKRQILGISAIPYIHHFDIYDELEELFQLPVTIENDANCAGIAEIAEGAAKGKKEVAFVVIGTGIGGAVFHDGRIVKGAHLYGGEFGLMYLNNGKTFSSLGTAVQMAWRYCDRKGLDRETVSGKEVFQLAEQGDDVAAEEVENFYEYLTQGLFSIQFSLDPEIIVLGGGISAKEGLLDEINGRMKKKLEHFELKDFVPEIVICDYRNDANLVGAAANFLEKQKQK